MRLGPLFRSREHPDCPAQATVGPASRLGRHAQRVTVCPHTQKNTQKKTHTPRAKTKHAHDTTHATPPNTHAQTTNYNSYHNHKDTMREVWAREHLSVHVQHEARQHKMEQTQCMEVGLSKACCDHKSRERALSLCGVTFRGTLCAPRASFPRTHHHNQHVACLRLCTVHSSNTVGSHKHQAFSSRTPPRDIDQLSR